MKKILKTIAITSLLLLTSCGNASKEKAKEILATHLKERYGEEFDIGWGGRDGYSTPSKKVAWFQFNIVPESYLGTNKLYDNYYDCYGTVMIRKKLFGEKLETPRDTCSDVLLKEQANDFYGKKLKELFGENVLPVLEVTGSFSIKNKSFLENVELTEKRRKENNNTPLYIEGGIYIFGRVENDEDREWYRKQIYEFVQFMKQTGTFEYTAIAFNVLDERVLSKEFQENTKLQQELVDMGAKNKRINVEYFREERRRLMNELPKNLTPYIKMEDINKSEIGNSVKWSYYNNLLSLPLYSEKYIRANHLEDTRRISKYEKVEDVFFTYEEY